MSLDLYLGFSVLSVFIKLLGVLRSCKVGAICYILHGHGRSFDIASAWTMKKYLKNKYVSAQFLISEAVQKIPWWNVTC